LYHQQVVCFKVDMTKCISTKSVLDTPANRTSVAWLALIPKGDYVRFLYWMPFLVSVRGITEHCVVIS